MSPLQTPLRDLGRWLPSPLLRASVLVHLGALVLVAGGRWRWGAAAVLADHLLLAAASIAPRSSLLGPILRRLPPAVADRKRVALTFDDGPDPEVTPAVLDLLAAADGRDGGHRATFFLIGHRAAAHPALVAEIVARGHAVENHTQHHRNHFALLGPRRLGTEIDRAQATLARLAGRPPTWFRSPAGMRNPWMGPLVSARGLAIAGWTRRGFDAVAGDADRVARRLTSGLAAGDILLLHDGSSARTPVGRPVVLEALPTVLAALDEHGLTSIALPDPAAVGVAAPAPLEGGR